ncbi:MAG: V-type ATPase subunit D [candidate division WWE3 bacterium GW2011_GWF2_41_45]|uniref:Helix-turn-helix domain-containing protein n=3 Tax=Katanobacteria TaxID=422282 RepID=A0A1F4VZG0_UNCKA|nr:MAG: V-type ATPase subunit D [candidate division WWE3 bacterium GW2011_GWC2_41_23]KKS10227.1 MAG: V-type ATPase subunit D [candidate division WWE3 bacterium GW2011_GWF2_41_45]KKS19969.1 MAG: V-type ATPase subunit D [candidate division WWE3 bacterium GW2011_GWE1_41_72]KKS28206.1 MAG: V-type ATPase subunit D [candidate division WWE3 bacterium GW2011_GWC1_42_102]KKS29125.1 MAG: V-type ATPase subunit D [candidate division WWE3 bacterium GW2011_GWD2_42_11]KKS50515.1 MAG: V-type ATPase subunit D 
MINLEDKLYTSTEVADILGVSLRSVYRYIEEDKLQAEVKTATGRHRFTKKNILDFLYPGGAEEKAGQAMPKEAVKVEVKEPKKKEKVQEAPVEETPVEVTPEEEEEEVEVVAPKEEIKVAPVEEEPIDWLAKFREAAKKFDEENAKRVEASAKAPVAEEKETFASITEQEPVSPKSQLFFYRSRLGGLKDIAQNIDKSSRNSGIDYAFTMNAGLSLFKAIKPFSVLHVYIKSKDKDFFERILMLTPSDENNAQLCIMTNDDKDVYTSSEELHGLFVADKTRLLADIRKHGDSDLIEEAESIL